MENQTQEPKSQKQFYTEHVQLIEKAIDVAVSKGCYNKMEIVSIIQSLHTLYSHIENMNDKVPTKFTADKNDNPLPHDH